MPEKNSLKINEESKVYKLPEIEKFSGSPAKYPAFLTAIRRMFRSKPNQFLTDHKKIDIISGHLTVSAMRCLNNRIMDILINSPLPKSISELMELCIDIDNRIASRETFRKKYVSKYENNSFRPYNNYSGNQQHKNLEPHNNYVSHTSHSQDGGPMDIDALKINPRGPLSLEEKKRRLESGLCLYCASDKHIVRDCNLCPQPLNSKPQQ
ncbi:hypothetical protein AYI69_g1485 [Smittium culicis]|uniref:Retrotransposon-derived protein PEG10 n=1 Tax=Smittium culicis TaxID=133412 RepID=A0A1R1YQ54_9FUNG|nr:hypothetical protein AYI69_g1485 [Smittium culicis]